MNILEQLESLDTDAIGANLIAPGKSIRIVPGLDPNTNEPNIGYTDVDGVTSYHIFKNLRLTRVSAREQINGMQVLTFNFSTVNEEIGIIDPNEQDAEKAMKPLPCYTSPAFARWATWYHLLNAEFQNPHPDAVRQIHEIAEDAGFTSYKMMPRRGQTALPERTSKILFDIRAHGNSLPERHSRGLNVVSATILPAPRKAPMLTEYESRDTGETTQREAFTSFPDAFMANFKRITDAKALSDKDEHKAEMEREAVNRLALLTGSNDEGYALRPTLGYLHVAGQDEEISFFPDMEERVDDDLPGGPEVQSDEGVSSLPSDYDPMDD